MYNLKTHKFRSSNILQYIAGNKIDSGSMEYCCISRKVIITITVKTDIEMMLPLQSIVCPVNYRCFLLMFLI